VKALIPYLVIVGLLCYSCKHQGDSTRDESHSPKNEFVSIANKYTVEKIDDYYLLKVFNPWQKADRSSFSYLLGENKTMVPDSLKEVQFIKTPVQRVIIMSTTFISIIDTLGESETICGVSGAHYVYNEKLRQRIADKKVKDVGYDRGLNYELVIELDPDVLFLYGVEAGVNQTIKKLEDLGVPVVMCADYLENEPLGRAEWIKFFGLFYEKQELATEIFEGITYRYDSIAETASAATYFPSVFVGLPWKDTWYIAGGQSFAARFIEDAGGSYVWKALKTTEAEPFDLESCYIKILDADIWINAGVADNLQSVLDHDNRFENIKAFEEGEIYNNNLRVSADGGNDYWESGLINPDKILNDLVNIFHKGNDSLYYYKRLR